MFLYIYVYEYIHINIHASFSDNDLILKTVTIPIRIHERTQYEHIYRSPILSLPKGRYPAYDGYPMFIVDWQIEQREKAIGICR
jgi:hypothetical protein